MFGRVILVNVMCAEAATALAENRNVRMAVNQDMASASATIKAGDEVSFFPPVTGW